MSIDIGLEALANAITYNAKPKEIPEKILPISEGTINISQEGEVVGGKASVRLFKW